MLRTGKQVRAPRQIQNFLQLLRYEQRPRGERANADRARTRLPAQVWEASAKRSALGIRQEELDFHIQRYTVLITQCSILVG